MAYFDQRFENSCSPISGPSTLESLLSQILRFYTYETYITIIFTILVLELYLRYGYG